MDILVQARPAEGVSPELRRGYRGDIDGLRAIAVLMVVFYHFGTRLTGGYVGVDVFFVISGYLISAHILAEMQAGRFSIARFYEKRVRRILPAMLVMFLVVSAAAWWTLLPADFAAFARTLVAAILSVSNLLFAHQNGYFDAPSEAKPLLHTWSLAVEEQFYLFFPLFLLLVRRWFVQRLRWAIWALTVLSFAAAVWTMRRDPQAAFFLAPLRAWELMLGTIASQKYLPRWVSFESGKTRNAAALAGLLLILGPALMYGPATPFPGWTALPPCLGAMLVLLAGEGVSASGRPTLAARVLAWRPVAFIGLISYSLYLWHWPVLVWQRTGPLVGLLRGRTQVHVTMLAVSLALATLSWWLVERPFRSGALRPGRPMLFAITGTAATVLLGFGVIVIARNGMAGRFNEEELKIAAYSGREPGEAWRTGSCFLLPQNSLSDLDRGGCLPSSSPQAGVPQDRVPQDRVLLMGDSLAAQLYPGLRQVFGQVEWAQATAADCRPLATGGTTHSIVYEPNCRMLSQRLYADYLLHGGTQTVVLAASWEAGDLPDLELTLKWLQQHRIRVILLGPWPLYRQDLPYLLVMSMRAGDARLLRLSLDQDHGLDARMAAIAAGVPGVDYVSVLDALCGAGRERSTIWPEALADCRVYAGPGVPLVFDTHHLTAEGSLLFARLLQQRMDLTAVQR